MKKFIAVFMIAALPVGYALADDTATEHHEEKVEKTMGKDGSSKTKMMKKHKKTMTGAKDEVDTMKHETTTDKNGATETKTEEKHQ